MSGWKGIRPTIRAVPERFRFQLIDPIIVAGVQGGPSFDYNHLTHRNPRMEMNEVDRRRSYRLPSTPLLVGLTETGDTVSIQVQDIEYWMYVKCPEEWDEAHMRRFFEALSGRTDPDDTDDYRIRADRCQVTRFEKLRAAHFKFWEPDPDDPSKSRRYNYMKIYTRAASDRNRLALRLLKKDLISSLESYRDIHFEVYEHAAAPVQQMLEQLDVSPGDWLEVDRWQVPQRYHTHTQVEVLCRRADLSLPKEKINLSAPMWYASWDIEVYSHHGNFPKAVVKENAILMINTHFRLMNNNRELRRFDVSFHLGPTEPVEGVHIFCFDTELELLDRWRDFIVLDVQPTVMVGYNIEGFDWKYVYARAMANAKGQAGEPQANMRALLPKARPIPKPP